MRAFRRAGGHQPVVVRFARRDAQVASAGGVRRRGQSTPFGQGGYRHRALLAPLSPIAFSAPGCTAPGVRRSCCRRPSSGSGDRRRLAYPPNVLAGQLQPVQLNVEGWRPISVGPPAVVPPRAALPSRREAPLRLRCCLRASSRGEFRPPALSEPGVSLSTHRAPIIQPHGRAPAVQWAKSLGSRVATVARKLQARMGWRRSRLYFCVAHRTR
jgi:hypothetical protein